MAREMFRWGCGKFHDLFGNGVSGDRYENIKVMSLAVESFVT
jgi:hypothetical protein